MKSVANPSWHMSPPLWSVQRCQQTENFLQKTYKVVSAKHIHWTSEKLVLLGVFHSVQVGWQHSGKTWNCLQRYFWLRKSRATQLPLNLTNVLPSQKKKKQQLNKNNWTALLLLPKEASRVKQINRDKVHCFCFSYTCRARNLTWLNDISSGGISLKVHDVQKHTHNHV